MIFDKTPHKKLDEQDNGRRCPTIARAPTEYDDYEFAFDDSLLGKGLAPILAGVGLCLIFVGVAGYFFVR